MRSCFRHRVFLLTVLIPALCIAAELEQAPNTWVKRSPLAKTPPSPRLAPPHELSIVTTSIGARLAWKQRPSPGVTHHLLHRGTRKSPGEVSYQKIASIPAGTNRYEDTDLRPGTVYYCTMRTAAGDRLSAMILFTAAPPEADAWKRIVVSVGIREGDFVGNDNKVLQGAVDYVASLGGGTVHVGPGEFTMYNSLHLRSDVALRGSGETTVLKKCPGTTQPLVLDGDYGQEEVTLADASAFKLGMGITVRDDRGGGFHTVVASIIGKRGNTL